jgi:hypothetical protein
MIILELICIVIAFAVVMMLALCVNSGKCSRYEEEHPESFMEEQDFKAYTFPNRPIYPMYTTSVTTFRKRSKFKRFYIPRYLRGKR